MGIQQLLISSADVPASGDPLWADVWLRLPLDDILDNDVSVNAFEFERATYVDFSSGDPLADILAGAAKWGAAGWQCHYDDVASEGSIYQVNPSAWSAVPSGTKTWGTKKWCAELWVKIGNNSEPAGVSQYRLDMHGSITASTQKFRVRTREGRVGLDVRSSLTGTVTVGSPSVGYREGTGASGTNIICWNDSVTPIITDNNFHWVAACYDGTTVRLLVDGVVVFQATATFNYDQAWANLTVGGVSNSFSSQYTSIASGPFGVGASATDAIDDVRITLSSTNDRYTSFPVSVPTEAFPTS